MNMNETNRRNSHRYIDLMLASLWKSINDTAWSVQVFDLLSILNYPNEAFYNYRRSKTDDSFHINWWRAHIDQV